VRYFLFPFLVTNLFGLVYCVMLILFRWDSLSGEMLLFNMRVAQELWNPINTQC